MAEQNVMEYRMGVADKRLDCHSDAIDKVGRVVEGMDKILAQQVKTIEDHEERIRNVEQRPAQRWNSLVAVLISAIATGFIGYMIGVMQKMMN